MTAGCGASTPTARAEPVALTPPDGGRFVGPAVRPAARAPVRRARDARCRGAGPPGPRGNELVTISLDGSDGAGRRARGRPGLLRRARGRRPTAGRWPGSSGTSPTCPGTRSACVSADVADDGALGPARTIAGGPGVSIVQPAWRADGVLHFVSDAPSGWWNLYALDGDGGLDGPARNLAPMEAELGDPAWVFGRSSYAFTDDGGILAVARADGRDALVRITSDGAVERRGRAVQRDRGAPGRGRDRGADRGRPARRRRGRPPGPRDRPADGRARAIARDPARPRRLPHAEPIAFPTTGGATARALYFPPTNDAYRGPTGELPPLLVISHGGPTSAASSALSLDRAFFTSRGIAVVDVDYRGSTGLRTAVPRRAQGRVGDRRRRRLRRGRAVPRGPGRGRPAPAGDPGRERGRLHDARGPDDAARGLRGGHLHFGIADLELIHLDGTSSSRATTRRCSRRGRRAGRCSATGRRSTRSTGSSPRC